MTLIGWDKYKNTRNLMEKTIIPNFKLLEEKNIYESNKLKLCGNIIITLDCLNCQSKHFAGYKKCRSRWCINCNHIRSLAWIARLLPILEELLNDGYYITKLNLTIKDQPLLLNSLNGLSKSWRNLTDGNATRKVWKERFPGSLRSLEVKIGKNSNYWHPHYHCLLIHKTYSKDYDFIKDRWKEVTLRNIGSEGSVWLQGFKHNTKQELLKMIIETVKYIFSPEKNIINNVNNLYEAYLSLKGRRQINTMGLIRKKLAENDIENDLNMDYAEEQLINFICSYCGYTKAQFNAILYSDIQINLFNLKGDE